MSQGKAILIYSNSLTSYLLFRDAIKNGSDVFCAAVQIFSVPKETGSFLPKTGILKKILKAPFGFVFLNFLFIHIYGLLSSISSSNLKKIANASGVRHYRFSEIGELEIQILKDINADYIFNNSSLILKKKHINLARIGVINYHGAPLPNYRGAANYFWVLYNNEPSTCGTLHYVDEGLDTGPIIKYSESIQIRKGMSAATLRTQVICAGRKLVNEAIENIRRGISIPSVKQSDCGITRSFPKRENISRFSRNGFSFVSLSDIWRVIFISFRGSCIENRKKFTENA